ncbi:MAG: ABA4-like family protein [Beijerinckiaceae bacterium]
MSFDMVFSIANSAALASWLALVALPRWPILLSALRYGVILALAIVYSTLVLLYFFRVEGGGFGTIAQVRALFASDPVLVAGWVHYLAFDLFVGLWIADKSAEIGLSRLLQAPILVATFMFGPLGLLLFYGCQAMGLTRANFTGSRP